MGFMEKRSELTQNSTRVMVAHRRQVHSILAMIKAAKGQLLPSPLLKLLSTLGLGLWFGADCSILSTALAQPTLAEALDGADLVWSIGGYNVWRGQTNVTHDGLDAAHSWVAPIQPYGNEPWLEVTVVGPGAVSS